MDNPKEKAELFRDIYEVPADDDPAYGDRLETGFAMLDDDYYGQE